MASAAIIVLVLASLLVFGLCLAFALKLKKALLDTKIDARATVELQRETLSRLREHERQSKQRGITQYRQIESLIELNKLLGFNITGLRHWAISPDAALLLYRLIIECKPHTVLELGGGTSSVITAQALKANRRGYLVTIDHNAVFAADAMTLE